MPRNRYTTAVHQQQCAQLKHRQKALRILAREVHGKPVKTPVGPVADSGKQRRRTRLERVRLNKLVPLAVRATTVLTTPLSREIATS